MKVKKIVEGQEEYRRLGELIEELKGAIDNVERRKREDNEIIKKEIDKELIALYTKYFNKATDQQDGLTI